MQSIQLASVDTTIRRFLVTALGMVAVALVALGLLGADIRKLGVLLDIDLWSYCNGT